MMMSTLRELLFLYQNAYIDYLKKEVTADDYCHERCQAMALKGTYQQLEAVKRAQASLAAGCTLGTTGGRGVCA